MKSERARSDDFKLRRLVVQALLWATAFVALVVVMVKLVDVDAAWAALSGLSLSLVLLVITLSLLNYLLRGLRWQYLCRHIDVDVPLLTNSAFYIGGFAFTVTPGKIGELVRLWFLKRGYGYGYARTGGLMVLDRLTDAWPLFLLALVGATHFAGYGPSLFLVGAVMVAGSAFMLHPAWLRRLSKATYAVLGRGRRTFARLLRMARIFSRFASVKGSIPPMLLGIAGWLCEIVGAWLILNELGIDLSLTAAAFVFGFGMLIGALPLFPGGLGGAEVTMVGLIVWQGAPLELAVTATAVIRLATLGFAVVIGFAVLPLAMQLSRPPARACGASRWL